MIIFLVFIDFYSNTSYLCSGGCQVFLATMSYRYTWPVFFLFFLIFIPTYHICRGCQIFFLASMSFNTPDLIIKVSFFFYSVISERLIYKSWFHTLSPSDRKLMSLNLSASDTYSWYVTYYFITGHHRTLPFILATTGDLRKSLVDWLS